MTGKEDLYIILEVGRTASVNEIKRAFRKLARRYHPDINPGDHQAEERFKRISEAYEILSDPSKRQFYDVNGFYTDGVLEESTTTNRAGGSVFRGFDFSRSSESQFGEFSVIFSIAASNERDPERGQDLEYQISISFDESMRGLKTRISVFRQGMRAQPATAPAAAPGRARSGARSAAVPAKRQESKVICSSP